MRLLNPPPPPPPPLSRINPLLRRKLSAAAPFPSVFRPDVERRKGKGSLLCMKVVLPCPDSPTTMSFMCLSVQRPSTCADPTCAELQAALRVMTAQGERAAHREIVTLPLGQFCGRA